MLPLVLPMAPFIIRTGEDGKDNEAEHDLQFPSTKAAVEDLQVSPAEAARGLPDGRRLMNWSLGIGTKMIGCQEGGRRRDRTVVSCQQRSGRQYRPA